METVIQASTYRPYFRLPASSILYISTVIITFSCLVNLNKFFEYETKVGTICLTKGINSSASLTDSGSCLPSTL